MSRCSYIKTAASILLVQCLFGHSEALAIDGTPTWQFSQVAPPTPGDTISSPSLAYNHFGTPSVSWSSGALGINTVYRSELSGLGIWARRQIATGTAIGLQTSLSFDNAERPTVTWVDGNGSVNAEFNDDGNPMLVASTARTISPILSISHDLAGNLRGMFTGNVTGSLSDISWTGTTYASSAITTSPNMGDLMDTRFTTDHSGLRHVIARAEVMAGTEGVFIASEPSFGGDWPSVTLATSDLVNGVGIATDPADGKVAIAYTTLDQTSNTSRLFYAKFNGVSLETTEVLSSTTLVFHDLDLAFDLSDGLPAIAFEQKVTASSAEQLMFAYLDAVSQWQTSLVDDAIRMENTSGGVRRPSLAFDDFGTSFPAIAYIDDAGGEEALVLAIDPPAVPEPGVLGMVLMGVGAAFRRRHRRRR